jgi:hypothetical protein
MVQVVGCAVEVEVGALVAVLVGALVAVLVAVDVAVAVLVLVAVGGASGRPMSKLYEPQPALAMTSFTTTTKVAPAGTVNLYGNGELVLGLPPGSPR